MSFCSSEVMLDMPSQYIRCSSELLLDMPSQIFTSQRVLASGLMLIVFNFILLLMARPMHESYLQLSANVLNYVTHSNIVIGLCGWACGANTWHIDDSFLNQCSFVNVCVVTLSSMIIGQYSFLSVSVWSQYQG